MVLQNAQRPGGVELGLNVFLVGYWIGTKPVAPPSFQAEHAVRLVRLRRECLQLHARTYEGRQSSYLQLAGGDSRVAVRAEPSEVARRMLHNHVRTHQDRRSFGAAPRRHACPLGGCGKVFSSHRDLARHSRTHTDERPFQCRDCGRRYKAKGSLTKHAQQKHSGGEPPRVECEHPGCGKHFSQRGHMVTHLNTHSNGNNNNRVSCGGCNTSFTRSSSLNRHIRQRRCAGPPQPPPSSTPASPHAKEPKGLLAAHTRSFQAPRDGKFPLVPPGPSAVCHHRHQPGG